MAERAERVRKNIDDSEKIKKEAGALLAGYEAKLKTAEAEAGEIIRQARVKAQKEAEMIIARSRVSAETEIANARRQAEMERRTAYAVFREEAAALVVTATGHLVSREIKNDDIRSYADSLIKELDHAGAEGGVDPKGRLSDAGSGKD